MHKPQPHYRSLDQDLDLALDEAKGVIYNLSGAHILLTGGTGFIGCWLLELIRHAVNTLGIQVRVTVLTRNPKAFMLKAPHLASCSAFDFLEGNILDFNATLEKFTHIIHGATDASAELNEHDPLLMYSTIVEGTRRILEIARQTPNVRLLFLSSGAVYGAQPWDTERVGEDFSGGPDPTVARNAYGEAKRAAEMLCAIFHKQFGVVTVIARVFTLLGPYLSLGTHFAAGNFISDAMQGRPITVNGNGLPRRSYMYAGDLVVWLLHLLFQGKPCRPYNVGSEQSVSIAELAQTVADVLGDGRSMVLGAADQGWNPGRYVPCTSRMRDEFGVRETVDFQQSILRTAIWNGWRGKSQ